MTAQSSTVSKNGTNLYLIFIGLFTLSLAITIWNTMEEHKVRKLTLKNEKLRTDVLTKMKKDQGA